MPETNQSHRLGTEPILPLLFRLSIPAIIAMSTQSLYNVVDSIYIGRLSTEALSALTLAFPVQLILIGISLGTGIGATSMISRLLGQGNRERAIKVTEHVLLITLFYGLIMALVGFFLSSHIIQVFTDEQELINMGSDYIRIILLGSITIFFHMVGNNILRAQGNTFLPMITMLIGSILNIILDPLFIFGLGFFPRWEIAGAAFATVLSRFISSSFLLYLLLSQKNEVRPNYRNFRLDLSIVRELYVVGFPAMCMQFLASFMLIGMNRILGSFSTTAVAAAGIFFRLQSFVFLPVFGLNQGYMPVMGYNYGHRQPQRMKETVRLGAIIATAFTTTGFVLFQLFPQQLVLLFNNDPELVALGSQALRTVSLGFPLVGVAIISEVTFQAMGRGLPSLALSFLRQILLLLPLFYLFGNTFGLEGIWYALPISEVINTTVAVFWILSFLKQTLGIMEYEIQDTAS